MSIIKIDDFKTVDENIKTLLIDGEKIINKYDLICLDTFLASRELIRVYLTSRQIMLVNSSTIETLPFDSFDIEYVGDQPKFNKISDFLTGVIDIFFTPEKLQSYNEKKALGTFSITRKNRVPMDYVLVKSRKTAEIYQSWALFRIIYLLKNGRYGDSEASILNEMITGDFGRIDVKFIRNFGIAFVTYVLARVVIMSVTDLLWIFTILDFIAYFGVVYLAYWVYKIQKSNNERFSKYFESTK